MTETVDVRTVGWNNPDCCYQVVADDPYQDDDGHWHSDYKWVEKLYCNLERVNVKTDYCTRCGKNLRYP